jgi:hypothetical protein
MMFVFDRRWRDVFGLAGKRHYNVGSLMGKRHYNVCSLMGSLLGYSYGISLALQMLTACFADRNVRIITTKRNN